jgi:hypothetical protein
MTCDFGYVTLHLSDVYERDQGIYTCKAYNLAGEAYTSTTIYCTGTPFINIAFQSYENLSIYSRCSKLFYLHIMAYTYVYMP